MQKKPSFISAHVYPVLEKVTKIIDPDYFRKYIGHGELIHLLIYVTGLVLCPFNPSMTSIANSLKLCRHDSLQRMLSWMNLPLRALSEYFIGWIRRWRGAPGYLMIDDTVLDKRYSAKIDCAGYAWSSIENRVVLGVHVVMMFWSDGFVRIPVGFRIWIPRKKTEKKRTKIVLALELLVQNDEFCRSCEYIAFDSWYCSERVMRMCALMGLPFVSRLKRNRNVIFKGRKVTVGSLRGRRCGVCLSGFGDVLVVLDDSGGERKHLVSSDTLLSPREVIRRYDSRWEIETCFRFMKQRLGLEGCQCRRHTAVQNHISLVLLAHFFMEMHSVLTLSGIYQTSASMLNIFHGMDDEFPTIEERRRILDHVA